MSLQAHLTGAFPRSERVVQVTRAFDRGTVSNSDVETALADDLTSLVNLQLDASLDVVIDGHLNWQDLFRPFSELISGIRVGGLSRWFDNNTFYRKPIIIGSLSYHGEKLERFFPVSGLPSRVARKAILPGPFTFTAMSQNSTTLRFEDLVDNMAHVIRLIVTELEMLGYGCLQFNEPCLCFEGLDKEMLQIAKDAYDTCVKGVGLKTILHTFFGDAHPVLDDLLDFKVDCIGLDLYETSLQTILDHAFNKELACGCVDGRNAWLESPKEIQSSIIGRIADKIDPKGVVVCPNCDLDFLPYSVAQKKVRLLGEIKKFEV